VDSAAGTLHRVRVGPFEERGSAEDVIRRLESSMPDLNPRLLDLRPDDEAPVTSPSDPMVRWVVQVGSFSEAGNAEQLVFRLRDAGFAASSRAISNDGALSYKVRVGPVLERDEAVALAASIRSRLGIDGLVMSAD
jgi:DedD protein